MKNKFYIEEEEIIIESYVNEPDEESYGSKLSIEEHVLFSVTECTGAYTGAPDESPFIEESRKEFKERKHLFKKDRCYAAEPMAPVPATGNFVTVDIEKLRQAGVPNYVIAMILENKEELSAMKITRSGRILLTDYKLEIKMTPLDKTLYFLYLRHPEGIRFKELSDFRDELSDIYASVTGRDDLDAIAKSIDALIDPMSNSVNEKCSHIKSAFTKAFSPELAKSYYIDGKSGEPKSIALDRALVTWETLRA